MRDPRIVGTCDGGDCNRRAVSLAFDPHVDLIPVCRRHITVYRVCEELLSKAVRYAQVSELTLMARVEENILQIEYEDQGVG